MEPHKRVVFTKHIFLKSCRFRTEMSQVVYRNWSGTCRERKYYSSEGYFWKQSSTTGMWHWRESE